MLRLSTLETLTSNHVDNRPFAKHPPNAVGVSFAELLSCGSHKILAC